MTLRSRIASLFIHPEAKKIRGDGWQNFQTGIGTNRDKVTKGRFWPNAILDHNELLSLYNGSNLAAKIVEKRPTEMFRRGYDLESDDADADELVKLREKSDAMRADENFLEAHIWGGLFGGALLIIGADDGQTPEKPLNEDNIKTIQYCNLVDRRFIWVQSYYSDPLQPCLLYTSRCV